MTFTSELATLDETLRELHEGRVQLFQLLEEAYTIEDEGLRADQATEICRTLQEVCNQITKVTQARQAYWLSHAQKAQEEAQVSEGLSIPWGAIDALADDYGLSRADICQSLTKRGYTLGTSEDEMTDYDDDTSDDYYS